MRATMARPRRIRTSYARSCTMRHVMSPSARATAPRSATRGSAIPTMTSGPRPTAGVEIHARRRAGDAYSATITSRLPLDARRLLDADIPGLLQVGARVGFERHHRLRARNAVERDHAPGDDLCQIVVLRQAYDGDQVILAGHRIDLDDAWNLQQRLCGGVDRVALHVDQY